MLRLEEYLVPQTSPDLSKELRLRQLYQLQKEIFGHLSRNNRIIHGIGNPEADIMLIRDAPGVREDAQARPLAGINGKILEQIISEVGLNRRDIWVTSVLKWCPYTVCRDGHRKPRPPRLFELRGFEPWLLWEISAIQPKIIVCLGEMPARVLIDDQFRMNSDRGNWMEGPMNTPAIATLHPSHFLQRNNRSGQNLTVLRGDFMKIRQKYTEMVPPVDQFTAV
ncbi:MAG: uracil-DNA glycosylase [Dehalococcoidia bacterium]